MYLLFDIGATKMRIAASRDLKTFGVPEVLETPQSFNRGITVFKNAARKLANGELIHAAAGGVVGPFNKERTGLMGSSNLPLWNGRPLKKELERVVKKPLFLENDTALVGLGEAMHGAGKGARIVAYITVSTGVNGVRVVNGKIDENSLGFEIGHQIIDVDKSYCPDCRSGTLEAYIGGRATERRLGKRPYDIHEKHFWDGYAHLLAAGVNNAIVFWSPEAVVVGGSMMKKVGIPLPRTLSYLRGMLKIYASLPKLRKARLGDTGGLWGALELLRQKTH